MPRDLAFIAAAAAELRAQSKTRPGAPVAQDGWTPERVADAMLAALRWADAASGRVGAAGIRGSMPAYAATLEDHLDEGWGLPEKAGDDEEREEERRLILNIPAVVVSAHEAALHWPVVYLHPANEGSARMLGLWLRCKVYRKPFEEAVKRRGTMSRASAFRLKDKGLSIISVGLDRDRVPLR